MGHKLAVDQLGLDEATLPLADLSGIQQGDALKLPWPKADVIVGNPPFHGDSVGRLTANDALSVGRGSGSPARRRRGASAVVVPDRPPPVRRRSTASPPRGRGSRSSGPAPRARRRGGACARPPARVRREARS